MPRDHFIVRVPLCREGQPLRLDALVPLCFRFPPLHIPIAIAIGKTFRRLAQSKRGQGRSTFRRDSGYSGWDEQKSCIHSTAVQAWTIDTGQRVGAKVLLHEKGPAVEARSQRDFLSLRSAHTAAAPTRARPYVYQRLAWDPSRTATIIATIFTLQLSLLRLQYRV